MPAEVLAALERGRAVLGGAGVDDAAALARAALCAEPARAPLSPRPRRALLLLSPALAIVIIVVVVALGSGRLCPHLLGPAPRRLLQRLHLLLEHLGVLGPPPAQDLVLLERDRRLRDERRRGEVVRARVRVHLGRRRHVARERVAGEVGGRGQRGRELVGRDVGERDGGVGRRAGRTGLEDGVVCQRRVSANRFLAARIPRREREDGPC